jgi:hypothetical protein
MTDADGDADPATRFRKRIEALAERAERDRRAFEPPADPPDEERAMRFLREGAGPAISLFVEARTGEHMIHFPPEEYAALEGAMNDWLALYAACYGVDLDADFALREAADLLLDTRNVADTAQLLTHVPGR